MSIIANSRKLNFQPIRQQVKHNKYTHKSCPTCGHSTPILRSQQWFTAISVVYGSNETNFWFGENETALSDFSECDASVLVELVQVSWGVGTHTIRYMGMYHSIGSVFNANSKTWVQDLPCISNNMIWVNFPEANFFRCLCTANIRTFIYIYFKQSSSK